MKKGKDQGNKMLNKKRPKPDSPSNGHQYAISNHEDSPKRIRSEEVTITATNRYQSNNHNNASHHFDGPQLPILKYRNDIITKVNTHQVVVISGETGCGKTTQVPKYIYYDCINNKRNVNILITQPRRIAAVSIAKRLSSEMNVQLGELVGYHVGMNPLFYSTTKIIIVTTGIFLQRLIHEKNLDEFTHIILDEVHERDIDIDFVLVLLKHILSKNPTIKLVLMSATISTNLFANYFSGSSIKSMEYFDFYKEEPKEEETKTSTPVDQTTNNHKNLKQWSSASYGPCVKEETITWGSEGYSQNSHLQEIKQEDSNERQTIKLLPDSAPIIEISTRMFPVNIFFLETIIKNLSSDYQELTSTHFSFDKKLPALDETIYQICYYIIQQIHINKVKREYDKMYSILVFLPGYGEILNMRDILRRQIPDHIMKEVDILLLHSNLTDQEQQEVFKKKNERKIILATNIAESSITIDDTYYVIDFCLVKELKFNVKTNHETLELNWASKASCSQRAGRAGRVGEGYVFRLITEKFFNQLEEFSSPELLRVPLEKIILRIKVWDCGEPNIILGRAIQPPSLKHIDAAISNLQNFGALTVQSQISKTGELTELGKVYSEMPIDIKYSRLIMLSFAFDLIEPAIVAAAVLSQEKSIFRKPPLSSDLYKAKTFFSNNSECDVVASYNAFKHWERLFGLKLMRDEFDRRVHSKRIYDDERDWCRDYILDPKILREVQIVIADIKQRLNKLQLYDKAERKDNNELIAPFVDFEIERNLFLFKIILSGAFYGKFIKGQYCDYEKLRKQKNPSKPLPYKINQTVTVRGINQNLKEEDVKAFFEEFGKITYYCRIAEEARVEYSGDYQKSIREILYLGSNAKANDQEFCIDEVISPNEIKRNRLKKPDYLFELKLQDMFTSTLVEVEHGSLNHVVIEENDSKVQCTLLVAEDYYMKNCKYLVRTCTKLPPKPMWDVVLTLIFAPHATFYSNDEKNQYRSFRVVGSENEFMFNYLFSSVDVEEINSIRGYLNDIVKSKDNSEINAKRISMIKKLTILLEKPRIKIIANEEWWRLFYQFFPEKKEERKYNLKPVQNRFGMEDQLKDPKFQNIRTLSKASNDFLQPLMKLNIKEDFRLWTPEGLMQLEEERKCFSEMRSKILDELSKRKKMVNLEKAEILCGYCNSFICSAVNLKVEKYCNQEAYRLEGWISGFVNSVSLQEEWTHKDKYVQNYENNYSIQPDMWVACKSNNHIFGYQIENGYYIAQFSSLKINYPTGVQKQWERKYSENNLFELMKEEKLYQEKRKELMKINLICELCEFKTEDGDEFLFHMHKDSNHGRKLTELLEEMF